MYESASILDSRELAALVDSLAQVGDVGAVGTAAAADGAARELLAILTELERVRAAAAAAQVRATVAFTAVHEQLEAHRREKRAALVAASGADEFSVWRARNGRTGIEGPGVAAQVALARRLSPHRGAHAVSTACVLTEDLPRTLAAMTAGMISEERAAIVVRETRYLGDGHRRLVDDEVAGDPELGSWGNRALEGRVRAAAYRADPHGATARAAAAEADRHVSIRPKPESMCQVSALLPLVQGVAVYAALRSEADGARRNAGEDRTQGQVMADTLVRRVTGQAAAPAVPLEVQVVISDSALFGSGWGTDDPGYVPGYGPVPSGWLRDLVRGPDRSANSTTTDARVWIRRLYATPGSGQLVAMESNRRCFADGIRRFLVARDKTCRTPWCDAPIRHADHVHDHADLGPTSVSNGQGTCVRCNHTKQLPGWRVEVTDDGLTRAGPHRTRWRTPLGLNYDSTAPPLLPAASQRYPGERYETDSLIEYVHTHALAG